MFEKIMFHCLREGQKGSNWAQYIVPWPNTKQPLQNLLKTINTAWNTVSRIPKYRDMYCEWTIWNPWRHSKRIFSTAFQPRATSQWASANPIHFSWNLYSDFTRSIFRLSIMINHLEWTYRNCSYFINFYFSRFSLVSSMPTKNCAKIREQKIFFKIDSTEIQKFSSKVEKVIILKWDNCGNFVFYLTGFETELEYLTPKFLKSQTFWYFTWIIIIKGISNGLDFTIKSYGIGKECTVWFRRCPWNFLLDVKWLWKFQGECI